MALGRDDLLLLTGSELLNLLCGGHPIDAAELDDREYRGISLNLPGVVERLTWKKFRKTFHRDPRTGRLRGWNVRVQQSPLSDAAFEPMRKRGEPVTFGHYEVYDAEGYDMPAPASRGLMIDYGKGGNSRLDPTARLRDPIVSVNGDVDLLLGWTFVDLGLTTVRTPSFFVLERDVELTHIALP